jgi:hypothetical protein
MGHRGLTRANDLLQVVASQGWSYKRQYKRLPLRDIHCNKLHYYYDYDYYYFRLL